MFKETEGRFVLFGKIIIFVHGKTKPVTLDYMWLMMDNGRSTWLFCVV